MLQQHHTIRKRIFVAGASRSGTTLLQSLLASHPSIHTFPETGAFLRILGMRRRTPLSLLGLSLGREKKALQRLAQSKYDSSERPKTCLTLKASMARIVDTLDHLTLKQGKNIWVEKTPRHFKFADILLRHIPASHFVHILRDGRDVVASIYLRAIRHPDKFDKQMNLEYGVRLWNEAVRKAFAFKDLAGHSTLIYEDLTRDPETLLRALCSKMGIAFESQMLQMAHGSYFILGQETWKQGTSTTVVSNTSKFDSVFTEPTRRWLENKLRLDLYRELRQESAERFGLEIPPETS